MPNVTTQEIIDCVTNYGRYNDSTSQERYRYYVRWNGRTVFARGTDVLVRKIKEIEGTPQ